MSRSQTVRQQDSTLDYDYALRPLGPSEGHLAVHVFRLFRTIHDRCYRVLVCVLTSAKVLASLAISSLSLALHRSRRSTHYRMSPAASNAAAASNVVRSETPNVRPSTDSIDPAPKADPFATPYASPNNSSVWQHQQGLNKRYFHSRRIKKGEIERPWLNKKDPREKWVWIIPMIGAFIGIGLAALIIFIGLQTVQSHVYCPVLVLDDFAGGLDDEVWTKEVELGGFGCAQSEKTERKT